MEKKQKRKKSWALRMLQNKQVWYPRNPDRKGGVERNQPFQRGTWPRISGGSVGENRALLRPLVVHMVLWPQSADPGIHNCFK